MFLSFIYFWYFMFLDKTKKNSQLSTRLFSSVIVLSLTSLLSSCDTTNASSAPVSLPNKQISPFSEDPLIFSWSHAQHTIDIASWNIQQLILKTDIQRWRNIATVLESVEHTAWKRDIFFFQEVFEAEIVKEIQLRAEKKGYHIIDQGTINNPWWNRYGSGLLTLVSKERSCKYTTFIPYEDESGVDALANKGFLLNTLQQWDKSKIIVNTHIQAEDDEIKKKQYHQLCKYLTGLLDTCHEIVLAGDLNVWFWTPLWNEFLQIVKAYPWLTQALDIDLYRKCNDWTPTDKQGTTKIDYVFWQNICHHKTWNFPLHDGTLTDHQPLIVSIQF